MPSDIYLMGSGIRGTLHFTLETIQALEACRIVYVLHNDPSILEFVKGHCGDVRDLIDLYHGQENRRDVYREISQILVEESAHGPGVGFLVHGHPLFLVSATEYTLELAATAGRRVQMLAGVSSFDTLLCDLAVDFGYALQMYDASTLITASIAPNPRVPLLVFQLATTMNPTIIRNDPTPGVLRPLVDHLLQVYPEHHKVTVVHSAATAWEPSAIAQMPLGELFNTAVDLSARPTLYVPVVNEQSALLHGATTEPASG